MDFTDFYALDYSGARNKSSNSHRIRDPSTIASDYFRAKALILVSCADNSQRRSACSGSTA